MCTDRSCYEDDCEMCRKIDRLCDWPYSYRPVYKKVAIKTSEQEDKFNKFMMIQINEAKKLGREFYKGIQSGKRELKGQNREII